MSFHSIRLIPMILVALCSITCAASAPTTAPAANSPGGDFTYAPAGIEVSWPAGWDKIKLQDFEWAIVPSGANESSPRWISLDVPTLPMHPPGMIPIGSVEKGYVNDLKKQFTGLDVKELTPPNLPNAKTRLVRVAWQKDGQSMEQTALLIVHDDHVYILRARTGTDQEQATQQAFDSVESSIKWVKSR